MVEKFLTKFVNCGIKIARVNSIPIINQFTLILYGVGVCCDVDIFEQTAHAQSINREVYGNTYTKWQMITAHKISDIVKNCLRTYL